MTIGAAEETRVVLRDGSPVVLRTMRSSDAAALVRFHRTLSAETTRDRFFAVHPELTDAEVRRFTHVDHVDREAVVATADGEIVGVARFDRLQHPTEAEIAFVVSDAWRGRGLGTALLRQLVLLARRAGIGRLRAETLEGNRRMVSLLASSGFPQTIRRADGVADIVVELGSSPR